MIDEKHADEYREIQWRELREHLHKCWVYLDDHPPEAGWEALTYLYAEDLLSYMRERSEDYPNDDFQDLLGYCAANLCGHHAYDFNTYKTRFGWGWGINDDLFADLEEKAVLEAKLLLESI